MPDFERLIDRAEERLAAIVRQTPVEPSPVLSRRLGVPVWLKLECLQVTGSFKIRGAYFAMSEQQSAGVQRVATCSAGNHALGMAHAAQLLDMTATIYVPRSVDQAKASLLRGMGADVTLSPFDGFDDTEAWARDLAQAQELPFISAYDQPAILAGNGGTLMREIRRQVADVETIVIPVGGGGMAGGLARCAARPARLIATQSAACPALARSLEQGEAVTRMASSGPTLAGGLEGGIGRLGFDALRDRVSQVVLASETGMERGVRWMLEHHQYLIEPSCATAIAACMSDRIRVEGPTVVVLSGRNVALRTLSTILGGN